MEIMSVKFSECAWPGREQMVTLTTIVTVRKGYWFYWMLFFWFLASKALFPCYFGLRSTVLWFKATTQLHCIFILDHWWDSDEWSQNHISHPADTQNSYSVCRSGWVRSKRVGEWGRSEWFWHTNILGSGLEILVDAVDEARFQSGSWWYAFSLFLKKILLSKPV